MQRKPEVVTPLRAILFLAGVAGIILAIAFKEIWFLAIPVLSIVCYEEFT
jgi:hypothetical protein